MIVTPTCDCDTPRVSGTGERREAERGAWSRLLVCFGSFSVLLNCLSQIEVRHYTYITHTQTHTQTRTRTHIHMDAPVPTHTHTLIVMVQQ